MIGQRIDRTEFDLEGQHTAWVHADVEFVSCLGQRALAGRRTERIARRVGFIVVVTAMLDTPATPGIGTIYLRFLHILQMSVEPRESASCRNHGSTEYMYLQAAYCQGKGPVLPTSVCKSCPYRGTGNSITWCNGAKIPREHAMMYYGDGLRRYKENHCHHCQQDTYAKNILGVYRCGDE